MTVFICVDDNFGLTFNNRRQSRDSVVIEKIREITGENRLFIRPFSEKMINEGVVVSENMLDECKEGDFCFVEDVDIAPYAEKISTLVLFKWNRSYPSDRKLTLDFANRQLKETFDFVGSSHEKITYEVWVK
ncbi:MAG: ribonuclease Z [Clostridia bacterium]|nr:ribonuclease Z [Clostridia bacterium]